MAKEDSKTTKKSLKDRIKEASTISTTSMLMDSKVFGKKEMYQTTVPMINVALSGQVDGGLSPGFTYITGASKNFKSGFTLMMVSAFLKKKPDGVVLFYDSEFGTPEAYFDSFGINKDQVIHTPITNIEELKFDITAQLANFEREDDVIIVIDSIGNLASRKEASDAAEQNSAADMTRAKELKSLFRILTPHLSIKDIPLVCVGHVYQTMELYAKTIVSGGTGPYLSADTIWILSRAQETEGSGSDKELTGYRFTIKIEKSRFVKEGSKIPVTVSFDGGIKRWSGLVEEAMDAGYIVKPKVGWYAKADPETGEVLSKNYRLAEIEDDDDFWKDMFKTTKLASLINTKYVLNSSGMNLSGDAIEFQEEAVDA